MKLQEQPVFVQVSQQGDITLSQDQVASLGLSNGQSLLLFPFQQDQFLLVKVNEPVQVAPAILAKEMQQTFNNAGYGTRKQVLDLVREVKQEMAQEW